MNELNKYPLITLVYHIYRAFESLSEKSDDNLLKRVNSALKLIDVDCGNKLSEAYDKFKEKYQVEIDIATDANSYIPFKNIKIFEI